MKGLYIKLNIILTKVVFLVLSANDYNFFPNLPTGEFKLYFKAVLPCSAQDDEFCQNLFLYKITWNTTETRGNITLRILFDDSLSFNFNIAVKDLIGGWKDNAFTYTTPNGCSSQMKHMGSEWQAYWKSFGINNAKCPIPTGVYITKGYDLSRIIEHSNFPKNFFYGTYKTRVFYTDKKKKEHGCVIYIAEVKRPWEIE